MPISAGGMQLLDQACRTLGIEPVFPHTPFAKLYDLLLEGSQRINLTALREESDIVLRHFVDSLTCLKTGLLEHSCRVLDLGTGAGFPGIPLAIARPGLQITLLDATQKKVEFVRQCLSSLDLKGSNAVWGRGELLGRQSEWRGYFDRVVSRAVGPVPMMLEIALPLLSVGGYLILQKGPEVDGEIERDQSIAVALGARWVEVLSIELPMGAGSRRLLVIQKIAETPDRYPRVGAALGRF